MGAEDDYPSIEAIVAALQSQETVVFVDDRIVGKVAAAADPGDLTIAEPAVGADGEPWLYVEFIDDEGFGFDLEVGFGDEFVHSHDAAIDRAVEFIRSLPGVSSAFRQDPEQILVTGTRDAIRVRDSLIGFFDRAEDGT